MLAYKLKFISPLHLGTDSDDQTTIEPILHSDTLFNSLIINWSLLFEEAIPDLIVNPPCKLSSAFPFVAEQLFFPVPVGMFDEIMKDESVDIKKWKKVDYIPLEILKKYLKNEKSELIKNDFEEFSKKHSCYSEKNRLEFGKSSERPRLTLDRVTNSSVEGAFFYSRDFFFNSDAGLFILVEIENQNEKKFEAALTLLGENGIGADRSTGKGQFVWEKCSVDLEKAGEKDKALLMSLYYPEMSEIDAGFLEDSSYSLIKRSGHIGHYLAGNIKRNEIRMLSVGSILSAKGRRGGKIVKVVDKEKMSDALFDVFRDGRGFLIKFGGE